MCDQEQTTSDEEEITSDEEQTTSDEETSDHPDDHEGGSYLFVHLFRITN